MTDFRCNNFPCQLSPGHPGPCNSLSEHEQEIYSDRERHDYLSQLNRDELFALASEWITLYVRAGTGDLLARVEEYLTEQTDRAYMRYYRAHKQTNDSAIPSVEQEHKYQHACKLAAEWTSLGDARELVRRSAREMRAGKLKGTRTKLHASIFAETGETLEQEQARVFGACGGKCGEAPCVAWNKEQERQKGRADSMTLTIGERLARKLFERRGNHSEMHLSEVELSVIIDAVIEWADKTAKQLAEKEDSPCA